MPLRGREPTPTSGRGSGGARAGLSAIGGFQPRLSVFSRHFPAFRPIFPHSGFSRPHPFVAPRAAAPRRARPAAARGRRCAGRPGVVIIAISPWTIHQFINQINCPWINPLIVLRSINRLSPDQSIDCPQINQSIVLRLISHCPQSLAQGGCSRRSGHRNLLL